MRIFHDSPKESEIIWYFVPDDREILPYSTAFASRIYERDEELEGDMGERFSPVPWRGGQPPCPEPIGGKCGDRNQWLYGISISDKCVLWPGTLVPKCCPLPLVGSCGGMAYGRQGFSGCRMDTTFDVYRPFGAAVPLSTNNPCSFTDDLRPGRGTSPLNTVAWTHFIDVDSAVDVIDGCTRTASLDTIDFADGDEVRIPTGGNARYVVVWVTLCDTEGTTVKRVYLLRHNA